METIRSLPLPTDGLEGARRIAAELGEARHLLGSITERLHATAVLADAHRDLSEIAEPLRQAQAVARSAVWRHISQALMTAERQLRELEADALVRRPA